jgi:D-lyxose ketol-isomerase
MKISICNKICDECAFNSNTKDTLYAETFSILENNQIFPCHKFLRSQTGSMNQGTEKLELVKVCRGYVAFVKKNNLIHSTNPQVLNIWDDLLSKVDSKELDNILTMEELIENHEGLKNKVYLGN